MDRTQTFIKDCLFTKCLEDPEKPFNENRFQDTLLLLPTDGGLTSRLQRVVSFSFVNLDNLQKVSQLESADKHNLFSLNQRINKNSKIALREYIILTFFLCFFTEKLAMLLF